jgi:16S rRNA C967 or C1407 C5-methylase (RsmB/RsmF family)/NOL1/NOP2/fmu family ribosome biogenesis protein
MEAQGPPWPPAFLDRMRTLLGGEFGAFLEALASPRVRGLRVNPRKVSPEELAQLLRVELKPVPWCPTGFLLEGGPGLGSHPAHLAGLFYLQDPSAMSVVEVLDPQPSWKVVDLAAAPGGKTTHVLSRLGDDGFVFANEVIGRRLRPLHENLDRWGSSGVVTAGIELDHLASLAPRFFDAALLDAPCSGEALLRRDPAVASQWSPAVVAGSARRQRRLLAQATELVRPGGILVYSTCTFEVEENEEQVAAVLREHPDWELVEIARRPGFDPGVSLPPWPTERAVRLWPHRVSGDGQFVARLQRRDRGGAEPPHSGPAHLRAGSTGRRRRPQPADLHAERLLLGQWETFLAETAPSLRLATGRLVARGPYLFRLPAGADELSTLPLARPGTPLGMSRPAHFRPSQALACLLDPGLVTSSVSWSADDERLRAFLRGETIESPGVDGWVLVCYERWGVGWGRRTGGVIKNFLPHHLRTQAVSSHGSGDPEMGGVVLPPQGGAR